MKQGAILYFSGTGNTYRMVKELSLSFRSREIGLEPVSMENSLSETAPNWSYLGICSPIYGFGLPQIVLNFIQKLNIKGNPKIFLLLTGADYIFLNHHAPAKIRRIIKSKGLSIIYERIIVLPSNWFIQYDDSLSRQLIEVLPLKTESTAEEVIQGKKRKYRSGLFLPLLTIPTHFFESRFGGPWFGRFLKVSSDCTLCALCSSNCPVENIILEKKGLKFQWKCIWCMRCIYNCPSRALKPGILKKSAFKNEYSISKVMKESQDKAPFITEKTRGFFKHFFPYLIDKDC